MRLFDCFCGGRPVGIDILRITCAGCGQAVEADDDHTAAVNWSLSNSPKASGTAPALAEGTQQAQRSEVNKGAPQ